MSNLFRDFLLSNIEHLAKEMETSDEFNTRL